MTRTYSLVMEKGTTGLSAYVPKRPANLSKNCAHVLRGPSALLGSSASRTPPSVNNRS